MKEGGSHSHLLRCPGRMPFFSKGIPDLTTNDLVELLEEAAVENVRLKFKREPPVPDETLKKLSGFLLIRSVALSL